MSRDHIFYVDMNGDGKKEVVSEINGVWNRVTIWSRSGEALYNAQFGPGLDIPHKNIRDIDVADLNGDGKKEIVVATEAGLVVALDNHCRRLWSLRPPTPPCVLTRIPASGKAHDVIVACENGDVLELDAQGAIRRRARVSGCPTRITLSPDGRMAIIGTVAGEVAGYEPPR